MGTGAGAHYDIARFGMEVFRASPRQADILIVAGRVSQKMAPVLRQVYDQMMEPKWVISMGVCASSGGMFNNYAIVQGVDQVVPVDVYAPGCPPTPETLIHAIETLHQLIEDGESCSDVAADRCWRRDPHHRDPGRNHHAGHVGSDDKHGMTDSITRPVVVRRLRFRPRLHPDDHRVVCRRVHHVRGSHRGGLSLRHTNRNENSSGVEWRNDSKSSSTWSRSPSATVRVRLQVAEGDATIAVVFRLPSGTEAMEREVFDMFGIVFDGHPDLTRILMPEDWDGHPLRKDYAQGRIPVQFKGAAS